MPIERPTFETVSSLKEWLEKECQPSKTITLGYKVEDLIADLDRIMDREWSDGIDAMGEDA